MAGECTNFKTISGKKEEGALILRDEQINNVRACGQCLPVRGPDHLPNTANTAYIVSFELGFELSSSMSRSSSSRTRFMLSSYWIWFGLVGVVWLTGKRGRLAFIALSERFLRIKNSQVQSQRLNLQVHIWTCIGQTKSAKFRVNYLIVW